MNKNKKVTVGVLGVACLAILACSTPTYAGFFDWFKNTPLNQEAAALRAVKRVTPAPAPSTAWVDMGDGDCVVEGVGWGTIVGTTCVGADWDAYDMAQGRTGGSTSVKPVTQVTSFQKELKVGDTGADVLKLQKTLSSLGYYKGSFDGTYGSVTKDAVKAFQRAKGQYLTTGAVVGPKTIENLNASLLRMPVTETEGPYNPLPSSSAVDKTKTMAKGTISTVVELVGWHNGTCVNGDIFPDGTYTIYSYAAGCGSNSPVFQ